ncbi:uncharacterized protein B0H18DRAFT_1119791 [Fomitopsis serialis]|uniref:uncharacterized protein n=1 Tax=Fomitopsis serialis TaxID=139415 RepID=UPI0020077DAA|nr:uncharacterized protein B0H18DRAFT_1119791 [Neoantrodia serialis]KAH9924775.1 hypothetical protein B0H18DRAFT_1119791 [Neoantrodia serialis]
MLQPDPYNGSSRKLVIAIDIGTTYSGAAYCVLDPGEIPQVLSVTRFPGQEGENKSRDVKIPSVLYYDQQGQLCAVGAEATLQSTEDEAYAQEWHCVKWFKLHLRPPSILPGAVLPPISVNKSAVEILADFLTYVLQCTKDFISETNPIGRQILESKTPIDFVLSHPNGWSGPQQSSMRRAAILAELVSDDDEGAARLQFVTEGEASLQFCIMTGLGDDVMEKDHYVTIVDCGGGTIDLSTYRVLNSQPIAVVESVVPKCLIQGSTMIDRRAEELLRSKLRLSRFSTSGDIEVMLTNFENTTKPTFRNPSDTSYVRFGGQRDTDEEVNIRRGVLSLSGFEMTSLFTPSIDAIKSAIDTHLVGVDSRFATILLVGGFATSPFLRSELHSHMNNKGLQMFTPEGQTSKAVAEGALWFYLNHSVRARVARHTYGTGCVRQYNPLLPEHFRRQHLRYMRVDGRICIPSAFAILTRKGTSVTEEREFSYPLVTYQRKISRHGTSISADVTAYRGDQTDPQWMDDEPDEFYTLCRITATPAFDSWKRHSGAKGPYWSTEFEVILLLGLTEMKAQIAWVENGVKQRTPANIIYDEEQ